MKLEEVCGQYDVPIQFIHQFVEASIMDDFKLEVKENALGNEAVQRLESCICLHSLGLDIKTIKNYISLEISKEDTRAARITILQNHRQHNLTMVHETKKIMDCIDCILDELKRDMNP